MCHTPGQVMLKGEFSQENHSRMYIHSARRTMLNFLNLVSTNRPMLIPDLQPLNGFRSYHSPVKFGLNGQHNDSHQLAYAGTLRTNLMLNNQSIGLTLFGVASAWHNWYLLVVRFSKLNSSEAFGLKDSLRWIFLCAVYYFRECFAMVYSVPNFRSNSTECNDYRDSLYANDIGIYLTSGELANCD